MLFPIGSALFSAGLMPIAGVALEAVAMYGLVALVIGLIAWSKFAEPPLSNPYPGKHPDHDPLHSPASRDERSVVAVPVAAGSPPARDLPKP
jgi:hypothetical protein